MSQPPTEPPPYQDPHGRPYGAGTPPQGQAPPPYPPYGAAPSPYQKRDGGGKVAVVVIVAVVGFVVLFCGGIIGGIALLVGSFTSAVEEATAEFDGDRRGGPDNPIAVAEGEAFTIDGMDYEAGWTVQLGAETEQNAIAGLRVVNDREDDTAEWVNIDFTFLSADEEVGEISCHSDGDISAGRAETLDCTGYGAIPPYDAIEVAAAF